MKYAYGIDFGTTNSTVTVVNKAGDAKKISIDPEAESSAIMRSVVYVNHNHDFYYGNAAINRYVKDIAQGKIAKKKKVYTGRKIKVSAPATAGGYAPDILVPEIIEVEVGEGGRLLQSLKSILGSQYLSNISVFNKQFSVPEFVGMFLKELKKRADNIVGEDVTSVVLGRPIVFVNDTLGVAIERLTESAHLAGFKNITFEYEPVGAAYDYGINIQKKHTALMFDFGGGTLDITIMEFPSRKIYVNVGIGVGGDLLNTDIFNEKIAQYFGKGTTFSDKFLPVSDNIFDNLKNWYSISLLKSQSFYEIMEAITYKNSRPDAILSLKSLVNNNLGFSLYQEIDRVKTNLSKSYQEQFKFTGPDISISDIITRTEFENIISHEIIKIKTLIDDALETAGLHDNEIDIVATTGGSSLIPLVKSLLINRFGEEKLTNTDAFTSVSTGLALRAHEVYLK